LASKRVLRYLGSVDYRTAVANHLEDGGCTTTFNKETRAGSEKGLKTCVINIVRVKGCLGIRGRGFCQASGS